LRGSKFLLVVLAVILFSSSLLAKEKKCSQTYLAQWEAILQASKEYKLSPFLLWAVISVESEFSSPYVIGVDDGPVVRRALNNLSGQASFVVRRMSPTRIALYPSTHEDGVRVVRALEAAGAVFDVGLGQINNRTARAFGIDPAMLLDVKANVTFTAFYLKRVIDRHGSDRIWKYNGSPAYRRKLLARLEAVNGFSKVE